MSLILNGNESGYNTPSGSRSLLRFHRTAAFIGAGVAVAGLGLKVYDSAHQAHEANKIQKSLKDPNYVIPQEFYQNREIARQMAQVGLPQQQYNNALNNQNQSQAAAIAAASRSSNPGASIEGIQHNTNVAHANLDAEDAQARNTNQRYFIGQNTTLGNQELAKQQNDVFDKYTREFNQMQAYRGASQQNLNSAANDASQLGMTAIANGGFGGGGSSAPGSGAPISADSVSGGSAIPGLYQPPSQQSIPYYQITQ